jgi:hypothetical protein
MDGSDDYFTDDIVFNEETLAVLENEEQKYLTQTAVSSWPPTKRQRTESGWNPGLGNRSGSQDEIEDLPEISLRDDGSYGVTPATSEIASSHVSFAPTKKAVSRPSALRYSTVIAQSVQPASRTLSLSKVQPSTHSRAPSLSQRRPVVQLQQVSSGKGRESVFNLRASLVPSTSTNSSAVGNSHLLQVQLEELRHQLEKVVFSLSDYPLSKLDAGIGE